MSSEAHHVVDQESMEARAKGIAKRYPHLLVITVVGLLGPKYV